MVSESAGRFAGRVLAVFLIVTILLSGIALRQWTWQKTKHVRFQHDIVNGFYWGSQTLAEGRELSPNAPNSWPALFRGYFALYDRVKREAYENDYQLDYPPLRLLAMSIWTKEVRTEFPTMDDGHPERIKPLLRVNLLCELISAVALFFLVRFWVRRASGSTESRFLRHVSAERRAWICGLTAASVAWLEPSMILDAHGWPCAATVASPESNPSRFTLQQSPHGFYVELFDTATPRHADLLPKGEHGKDRP